MIFVNGKQLDITLFPDQTSQVWKLNNWLLNETNWVNIVWNYSSEGELLHLAQLKDLLDKHNIKTQLTINYLPYARQDKEVTNESTFALRSFSKLLNVLKFDKIKILDPHSKTALNLINNSDDFYPIEQILNAKNETNCDLFCYPDKGATEEYINIYDFSYVYGEKVRNQLTGNIENYKLIGNVKDKSILIVDDICDGGGTFILLAQQLKESGATDINLFVTHGLFTKGIKVLTDSGIKRIFTKDSEISVSDMNRYERKMV